MKGASQGLQRYIANYSQNYCRTAVNKNISGFFLCGVERIHPEFTPDPILAS